MRSVKVLEMLNEGKIDELKNKLQDEIYTDSLKGKPTAKKRYTAMKKYFSYTNNARKCCQKPIEQYSIHDYVDEWNKRCKEGINKDGHGYALDC